MIVKIYSVGVWNKIVLKGIKMEFKLKFTPLEFETDECRKRLWA